MNREDDLILTIETNEEETEIALVVRAHRKISASEFILELEAYLHEVSNSEHLRSLPETSVH